MAHATSQIEVDDMDYKQAGRMTSCRCESVIVGIDISINDRLSGEHIDLANNVSRIYLNFVLFERFENCLIKIIFDKRR